jgi:hypothetical protein
VGADREIARRVLVWHTGMYAAGLLVSSALASVLFWFAFSRMQKLLPEDPRDVSALVRLAVESAAAAPLLAVPAACCAALAFRLRRRTAISLLLVLLGFVTLLAPVLLVTYSLVTLLAPHYAVQEI